MTDEKHNAKMASLAKGKRGVTVNQLRKSNKIVQMHNNVIEELVKRVSDLESIVEELVKAKSETKKATKKATKKDVE